MQLVRIERGVHIRVMPGGTWRDAVREVSSRVASTVIEPHRTVSAVSGWLARPDVRAALVAVAGLRMLCSLVAGAAPLLLTDLYPWVYPHITSDFFHVIYPTSARRPVYSPLDYLVQPWNRWDTVWYAGIAAHGYSTYGSTAFLPLYPGLMRVVAPLFGGDFIAAGLLISTVAAFFFMLALYRLAERLAPGRGAAPYTLLIAALLPTTFFFMSAYTESLFLAFTLWAALAALDRRWGAFALLGGLAALTRQQGLLIAIFAVPEALAWVRWRIRSVGRSSETLPDASAESARPHALTLAAGLVPLLAYASYALVVHLIMRAPMPWDLLVAKNAWNLHFAWPWSGLVNDLTSLVIPTSGALAGPGGTAMEIVMSVGAATLLAITWRRLPPGLALYFLAIWLSSVTKVLPSGLTVSSSRYMLQMLPLCVFPAAWLARGGPPRRLIWAMCGTACLAAFTFIFALGGWIA